MRVRWGRLRPASCRAWLACAVLLATAWAARAEQLPFRHYGMAEGLGGSLVRAIYQDREGYLWFGSSDGLSRYDGYRFTNYGIRDGLIVPGITAIAEDRQGRLWVGTNGAGVARLAEDPPASALERDRQAAPGKRFVVHPITDSEAANRVNAMAFDNDGNLWCVTDRGLYRGDPEASRFEAVVARGPHTFAMPLLADGRGRVWAGIHKELVLVERGQVIRWEPPDRVAEHQVRAIVEDPQGRVIAAHDFGLFEHLPKAPGGRGSWRKLPIVLVPLQRIRSM